RRVFVLPQMEADQPVKYRDSNGGFSFPRIHLSFLCQSLGVFMKRERTAWLISFLLLAIVALPNPLAAQPDSTYLWVRTLVDINHHVLRDYVEPVDETKLEQAAINGMLSQLDPYTNYVPPAEQEQFDRMLEGTFKGVGIQLNQLENGDIEVVT